MLQLIHDITKSRSHCQRGVGLRAARELNDGPGVWNAVSLLRYATKSSEMSPSHLDQLSCLIRLPSKAPSSAHTQRVSLPARVAKYQITLCLRNITWPSTALPVILERVLHVRTVEEDWRLGQLGAINSK